MGTYHTVTIFLMAGLIGSIEGSRLHQQGSRAIVAQSDDRVDVTAVIARADSAGKVRCCCDMKKWYAIEFGGRSDLCVLVKGVSKCGDVPKSTWAQGGLHHYASVGGKCLLTASDAEKAKDVAEYTPEFPDFQHLNEVGPGFWNVRAPFVYFGMDVKTHMSLARLGDGSIVAIDAVNLTEQPGLKEEIDVLTDHGKKLTAVLATHPFHTLFFPGFDEVYPAGPDRQYYGAPRLLRRYPNIPWAGNITSVFTKWPDLEMLLPEGGEWIAPVPEETNHLMNVLVLHKPSKTVHNNDAICVVLGEMSGLPTKFFSFFLEFLRPGMHFHNSLWTDGLYHTQDAPGKFQSSIERLLEWDFENLCTAHNGNSLGDAKRQVQRLLDDSKERLQQLAKKWR